MYLVQMVVGALVVCGIPHCYDDLSIATEGTITFTLEDIYFVSQKKLTTLKRHSPARKQDKSANYNLLERKISNLEINTKL